MRSEEFDLALRESAADALGTPVDWDAVEVGFFPPRLIARNPSLVAQEIRPEDASLRADSVDLRLSALAILDRRVQVDSLVLRGVELVATRTPEGWILPFPEEASAEDGDSADPEMAPEDGEATPPPNLKSSPSRCIVSRSKKAG